MIVRYSDNSTAHGVFYRLTGDALRVAKAKTTPPSLS
jgi:hypothetical protein